MNGGMDVGKVRNLWHFDKSRLLVLHRQLPVHSRSIGKDWDNVWQLVSHASLPLFASRGKGEKSRIKGW